MKPLRVATILCALWTSCALAQTPSQPMVPSGGGSSLATPVSGANGGTGVANTGSTITLGASVVTMGTGVPTFAFPATPQTYTFPAASASLAPLASPIFTGTADFGAIQIANGSGNLNVSGTNLSIGVSGSSISLSGQSAFLMSPSAATIQHGAADAASPVSQLIKFQSVIAGTNNTAGVNATIIGSLSTGSGTSGDIVFQTGGTGAGATVQNSAVNALVLKGATQLVELPAIASDATHTDSSVCQDTTTHALYAGSGAAGICLGTSSIRFKPFIADLDVGLPQIMALQPISYKLDAAHGDPDKVLYGFTAEQGGTVLPQLMGRDAQGQPNTFDYLGVVPVLVKALQEQQAEIAELKRQIRGEAVPTLQ